MSFSLRMYYWRSFHSKKCEYGQQLDATMKFIQKTEASSFIFVKKVEILALSISLKHALQEKRTRYRSSRSSITGLPADDRDFNVAIEILKLLDVKEINLLTNNPDKIKFVENSEIHLNKRIPLQMETNENSKEYLKTKKNISDIF